MDWQGRTQSRDGSGWLHTCEKGDRPAWPGSTDGICRRVDYPLRPTGGTSPARAASHGRSKERSTPGTKPRDPLHGTAEPDHVRDVCKKLNRKLNSNPIDRAQLPLS